MPRSRTSSDREMLVPLDRSSREPLHRQLEQGLRGLVRAGGLEPGASLPSTRSLASQLGVSRGIVVEAYEQLSAEGYLVSRPGGTTRVARTAGLVPAARPEATSPRYIWDFRSGRPDVS